MTYILSSITVPNHQIKLFKSLSKEVNKHLRKIKKSHDWLQYAKITKTGKLRFLSNKSAQWQALESIATTVSTHNSSYSYGKTIDILSQLTNHTIMDMLKLNKLKPIINLDILERAYLNNQLISIVNHPQYIPLYPWLMPTKTISSTKWLSKDLSKGNKITVKMNKKTSSTIFTLHY